MNPNVEYKKLKFNPFNTKNCNLINNVSDPDVNLFNESHLQNLDTPYLNIEEAEAKLFSLNDPIVLAQFQHNMPNWNMVHRWVV